MTDTGDTPGYVPARTSGHQTYLTKTTEYQKHMTHIDATSSSLIATPYDQRLDTPLVGGKALGLWRSVQKGQNVPFHVTVTTEAYDLHVDQVVYDPKRVILDQLDKMSTREFKERKYGCSPDDIRRFVADLPEITEITIRAYQHLLLEFVDSSIGFILNPAAASVALLTEATPLPEEVEISLRPHLEGKESWYFATRSSSPQEDKPGDAAAGMHDTVLNQQGWVDVLAGVRRCFGSLFSARAWQHRDDLGYDQTTVKMAVVVMRMIPSEFSGVVFSTEMTTSNPDRVTVTAVRGLGEGIVQGNLIPQIWEIRKRDRQIIRRDIVPQERMLIKVRKPRHAQSSPNRWAKVPSELQEAPIYTDDQILWWFDKVMELRTLNNHELDLEFADYDGEHFLVQERPVSVNYVPRDESQDGIETAQVLLRGIIGSPHVTVGRVRKIKSPRMQHLVQPGEILVTQEASPEYGPSLSICGGVVSESGGPSQHGAIIARQRKKGAIMAVKNAMKLLKDGDLITVCGFTGNIYVGAAMIAIENYKQWLEQDRAKTAALLASGVRTKVKIMGIVASQEESIDLVTNYKSDGAGLLRLEHVTADMPHAMHAYETGRSDWYVDELTQRTEAVIRPFDLDQTITIRFPDNREFEFAKQEGGLKYRMVKPGPKTGPNLDMHIRGIRHYLAYPPATMLYARVMRNLKGIRHINAMAPFCDTVENTVRFRKMLQAYGLHDDGSWNFYVMWELPSTILNARRLIKEARVQGGSIGSNDLTMFTGGADRNVDIMRNWFTENDPSILRLCRMAFDASQEAGIPIGSCGNGPSDYPEFGRELIRMGFDSLSLQPDAINKMWGIAFEEEGYTTSSISTGSH